MLDPLHPALVIARREVRDQLRDWRIIFPVLGLTVFFPFLMNFTAQQMLDFVRKYGADIIGERLVPFLLMIVGFFPISVSLVIALDSFVGEKERGSIEPLLNTPLYDWQLYLGKLLAATVPPLLSSYLGMAVYMTGLLIENIPLPPFNLLIQIFMLTTVQAIVMVAGGVVVSCQATSVRAANLLSSFIVIPAALLIQGESVVMFWGDFNTLWWAVFGLIVFAFLLVRVGLVHFRREELLGREIDVLNLRWGWRVFRQAFVGGARSLLDWYRRVLPQTVRQLAVPIALMTALLIVGVWIGNLQVERFRIPLERSGLEDIDSRLSTLLGVWPVGDFRPVFAIFFQNLRVLLLAFVLGFLSFGILGVLPAIASLSVVGYLMGLLAANGLPVTVYLVAFILPHGILEIPAAILASAAILKAGAVLAMPTPDKTVGEVYLESLAEYARVMLGAVIPLLFLAACIEAWGTPRLALWLFQ